MHVNTDEPFRLPESLKSTFKKVSIFFSKREEYYCFIVTSHPYNAFKITLTKNSVHNFFYSFFCGLNRTCILVCICICYVDCHDLKCHEVIIGPLDLHENLDWSHNEENGDISGY